MSVVSTVSGILAGCGRRSGSRMRQRLAPPAIRSPADLAWRAGQLRASAPSAATAQPTTAAGPGPDQGPPQTRPIALGEVRQGESVRGEHRGDFLDGAHVGDVVAVKVDAQVFAWPVIAAGE